MAATALSFSLAALLLLAVAHSAAVPDVTLVLSFCTSSFDGKGAVVTVHPDATFKIIATFALPKDVGSDCPSVVNDDVVSFIDKSFAYLDFTTQWGIVLKIDLRNGSIASSIKPKSTTIFDGFQEFDSFSSSSLTGLAGHVEASGHYCENGCFSLGHMRLSDGEYTMSADIPYKAIMTGAHLADHEGGKFFTQASYPLTPQAFCSSDATQLCFVTIDGSSGDVLNVTGPNAWVAYAYMLLPSDPNRALVWAHDCISAHAAAAAASSRAPGAPRVQAPRHAAADCNYAFMHVDIASSSIVANISRVPPSVVVRTTPENSIFSSDGLHLAQASGNAYTGVLQVLVFDVATGHAVLDTDVPGLKESLGVAKDSPFISVSDVFGCMHFMSARPPPRLDVSSRIGAGLGYCNCTKWRVHIGNTEVMGSLILTKLVKPRNLSVQGGCPSQLSHVQQRALLHIL